MSATRVTMLNIMAGHDFLAALDRLSAWDIRDLDLKAGLHGQPIQNSSEDDASRMADAIAARKLSVHCLSTELLFKTVEEGERAFREAFEPRLEQTIRAARRLGARFVRLLSARTGRRAELADAVAYVQAEQPWLIPLYREFVDRIHEAGLTACIENETGGNLFASPAEIAAFFGALNRPGKACLTWDIVNLWQEGAYPSPETYRQLKPHIGYLHVKGGRSDRPGGAHRWGSTLADPTWPAKELLTQIVRDGVTPLICLNPPHGVALDSAPINGCTEKDLAFVRAVIAEA